MNLAQVAEEIQHRNIHIFGRDVEGNRAINGGNQMLSTDPHFRDYVHFYEVSAVYLGLARGRTHICAVFPCGQRQRLGSITSNWLVCP
jgi:hypothetical protein